MLLAAGASVDVKGSDGRRIEAPLGLIGDVASKGAFARALTTNARKSDR